MLVNNLPDLTVTEAEQLERMGALEVTNKAAGDELLREVQLTGTFSTIARELESAAEGSRQFFRFRGTAIGHSHKLGRPCENGLEHRLLLPEGHYLSHDQKIAILSALGAVRFAFNSNAR